MDYSDWKSLCHQVSERNNEDARGETVKRFDPSSKTLMFETMKYCYGPMVVGLNQNGKRRTLWVLDVDLKNYHDKEWHIKTKTWPVMRTEFKENRSATKQRDSGFVYDGLSFSNHFIERIFQRNVIRSTNDYNNVMLQALAGIVRLDTKNLAEDFLAKGNKDICILFDKGVFYVALDTVNKTGRMIGKTYIPFSEMSKVKKEKCRSILLDSGIRKKSKAISRFSVISSDNHYEDYEDFVKDYVISDCYTPPTLMNQRG
jgi:hypothetical protein